MILITGLLFLQPLVHLYKSKEVQKTLLTGEMAITYHILKIDDSPYTTKLINLGIVPGCSVKIVRKAPFGRVYYIQADNNFMALRQEEMACIHIA